MMRDIGSARQKEMLERIFFHDVMNSTASLESVVRLLEPDIPRTGENGDLVDVLKGAAGDVAEQIRYFRKLSQAESGAMEVEWVQIDLDGEVAEVAAAMDQSLRFNERDVSVVTELAGGSIVSDRVLVRRIVLNMLKNAAEASGRGETVTVTTRISGDRALVSVHNELVMTPEVRNQVFQRSFSTKSRRRGLGTYSMKLLSTRYLGGDVTFVSGEGQGTTFTLTIPVNPPHAPEDSSARNRNLTEA
jgi:signal transduction histidine kinase